MRRWTWIGLSVVLSLGACLEEKGDYEVNEAPSLEMFHAENAVSSGEDVTITPQASGPTLIWIEIVNSGNGPLKLSEITLTSDYEGAFHLDLETSPSAEAPIVIPAPDPSEANAPYRIPIRYTVLSDVAAPEATLRIRANADAQGLTLHMLTLKVAPPAPKLILSPSVVDFGSVSAGVAETAHLQVLNTGGSDLQVHALALHGRGFSVVDESLVWTPATSHVGFEAKLESPWTIPPGQSRTVKVRFTPYGPQEASGELRLYSDDTSAPEGTVASLLANSGGPCIAVKPQKIQFGGKLVGGLAEMEVDIISCGDAPLVIDDIALLPGSSEAFQLKSSELTFPHSVGISEKLTVTVTFVPGALATLDADGQPIPDLGHLRILSNTYIPETDVEISGYGVDTECPQPVVSVAEGEEVCPQTVLHLVGSQSFSAGGNITAYAWQVTQPVGSRSPFLPSASSPDPSFEANVAGVYTFTLDVDDASGGSTGTALCPSAQYQVVVVPCEAIHVELLWDTPNDSDQTDEGPEAGADLDLHFLHPFATGQDVDGDGEPDGWFDVPFDTFWFNKQPNWASMDPMVDDNPGLDRDDTNGAGPENVNLNEPEEGSLYRVGVHYWNDHGFGASTATVRIYIHAVLVFERELEMTYCDLWDVATISWPSGIVTPVLDNGQPDVVSYCAPPLWAND